MVEDTHSQSQSNGEATAGPPRDPLADYVLSAEQRAAKPTNSPLENQQATLRERQAAELEETRKRLAEAQYSPLNRAEPPPATSTPTGTPEPGVWPPPVYQEAPPSAPLLDPLYGITPYKSPLGLARGVTALFSVLMLIAAVMVTADEMHAGSDGVSVLFVLCLLALLAALSGLMTWTSRAYTNLGTFHAGGLSTTPSKASVSWIIPILWFYRPFQIVSEIWKASDPYLRIDPLRPNDWKNAPSSPLLLIWWIAWLVPYGVNYFSRTTAHSISGYCLGIGLAWLASSALTVLVVNLVSNRQEEKIARLYR